MAKHPDVQRKAHAEIDRVVWSKRLPNFNDRSSGKMPYIEAIYREVLSLAPPLPLCVPHAATEDDHYNGYFIPKGEHQLPRNNHRGFYMRINQALPYFPTYGK